jgi:agmatine deiminase
MIKMEKLLQGVNLTKRMLAEWDKQRCVMLSFPHKDTDWADVGLKKSLTPFVRIAQAIAYYQPVYIICKNKEEIASLFCSKRNIIFFELDTNDTWIRDYGFISIKENGKTKLLDFRFDGWGNKFESSLDNKINSQLYKSGFFADCEYENIDFTLEGGSIESDGNDTILTTSKCLCNINRNGGLSKNEVEKILAKYLGTTRVLWLDYGYLSGDDTDSHIDTLVRFVNHTTITYVKCDNNSDEHYDELKKMEQQLKSFTTVDGKPYNLIPLPMPEAKFDKKGNRLPATYANFLITNDALLYPTYDDKNDKIVGNIFKELFPNKEIIPINCLKLIEQGGSLHCSTMQVAK